VHEASTPAASLEVIRPNHQYWPFTFFFSPTKLRVSYHFLLVLSTKHSICDKEGSRQYSLERLISGYEKAFVTDSNLGRQGEGTELNQAWVPLFSLQV
jgi:hypothetical protein